jgi:hypothetical protein
LKHCELCEQEVDALLDAFDDKKALVLAISRRMELDFNSSLRYLEKEDRPILQNLIFEIHGYEDGLERHELRDIILQFYGKVGVAVWKGRRKKKLPAEKAEKRLVTGKKSENAGKTQAKRQGQSGAEPPPKKILARAPLILRPAPEVPADNSGLVFQKVVKRRPGWLKVLRLAEERRQKEKTRKFRKRKPRYSVKDPVDGWRTNFLNQELGIDTPVSKGIWAKAFKTLSPFEEDVLLFCFAGNKSFAEFSRKKFGTPSGARQAYLRSISKFKQVLLEKT